MTQFIQTSMDRTVGDMTPKQRHAFEELGGEDQAFERQRRTVSDGNLLCTSTFNSVHECSFALLSSAVLVLRKPIFANSPPTPGSP